MARSIVCGVDNSVEARRAAELTLRLADAFDVEPILVHATDGKPGSPTADLGGAKERILDDRPERALAQVAAETDAMLVAVGSRGRGPLRSALMGSTSRATMRAVDCPVLVVPPTGGERSGARRAIVCGVDGSPASDHALAAAQELCGRLDRELMLLSVQESASIAAIPAAGVVPAVDLVETRGREEAERALERAATRIGRGLGIRRRIRVGDVVAQLVATADEEEADLIVIGASEPGGLHGALAGSVSTVLSRHSPCPFLVVPEGASLAG